MNNEQFGFLDLLNILGFIVGIMNYTENLTQSDKQDILKDFQQSAQRVLDEVNKHLEIQDKKLDEILKRMDD